MDQLLSFDYFTCPNCNKTMSVLEADAHLDQCLKTPINLELFGPNANQNEQSSIFGGARSIMGESSLHGFQHGSSNISGADAGSFFLQSDLNNNGEVIFYSSDEEVEQSEDIDLAPVPPIQADAENFGECPICCCTVFSNEDYRRLPCCGTTFHRSCLNQWLRRNHTCPKCRAPVH